MVVSYDESLTRFNSLRWSFGIGAIKLFRRNLLETNRRPSNGVKDEWRNWIFRAVGRGDVFFSLFGQRLSVGRTASSVRTKRFEPVRWKHGWKKGAGLTFKTDVRATKTNGPPHRRREATLQIYNTWSAELWCWILGEMADFSDSCLQFLRR